MRRTCNHSLWVSSLINIKLIGIRIDFSLHYFLSDPSIPGVQSMGPSLSHSQTHLVETIIQVIEVKQVIEVIEVIQVKDSIQRR